MNISDVHRLIGGEVLRSKDDVQITDVSEWHCATTTDAVFLFSSDIPSQRTNAALIVSRIVISDCETPQIIVENPRLSMARLLSHFYPPLPSFDAKRSIHAAIDSGASIHPSAGIDSFAVISNNVSIHEDVFIGSHVVIGEGCVIEQGCRIYPNVTLYANTYVGSSTIIHSGVVIGCDGFGYEKHKKQWVKIPQKAGVRIGSNVEIGALTTIDGGCLKRTVISDGVKIDNHVHLAHHVLIGANTIIAGGGLLAGGVTVGEDCILAGDVSIRENVHVGNGVTIMARSGVTKSIKDGVMVAGFPAQPVRKEQQFQASLRRLIRNNCQ